MELSRAGPKDVDREAEPKAPSRVRRSDFVGCPPRMIIYVPTSAPPMLWRLRRYLPRPRHATARSHEIVATPAKTGMGMKKPKRSPWFVKELKLAMVGVK
jgi:hypothetical protein